MARRGSCPGRLVRRAGTGHAPASRRRAHSGGGRRPARNDRAGTVRRSFAARAGRFLALAATLASPLVAAGVEREPGTGRVLPGYAFEFPRDHFAHPAFDSEWWYYTGNLFTAGGRHFGFELTFFRRARETEAAESSAWDLDQVWLAHFTITDSREERFVVDERINRSGPGIAGADASKRRIWNGNWSIGWRPGDEHRPTQVVTAMNRDASLRLTLAPRKPVVIHGRDGVSRKVAGDPRAVSHYFSFTRLAATGTVSIGEDEFEVTGLAWMDHEFFSDYPMEDKVGWDWMSIQLDDGADLMLFGLRDAQGGHGPDTTGTLVDADGGARRIEWGGVRLRPGRRWRSEATGRRVPGRVGGRDSGARAPARRPSAHRRPGGPHRGRAPPRVLGRGGSRLRRA